MGLDTADSELVCPRSLDGVLSNGGRSSSVLPSATKVVKGSPDVPSTYLKNKCYNISALGTVLGIIMI